MGISFTSPRLLWFLLFLIPLALLYVYFARRQSRTVPSLHIWGIAQTSRKKFLSPPLKRLLEWICASLFLCSTVFVAAGIQFGSPSTKNHLILLLDNSSSMKRPVNSSPSQTLLQKSRDELQRVLASISTNRNWTLVRLSPVPRVVKNGQGPPEHSDIPVRSAPLIASPARLTRFLSSLISDATSDSEPRVYFFTDRQVHGLPGLLQKHRTLNIVPIGGPDENVAITNASLRQNRAGPNEFTFELQNFSSQAHTVPIRLHGFPDKNLQTSLSPGEIKQKQLPLPPDSNKQTKLGLYIDANDSFPQDNGAYLFRSDSDVTPVNVQLPTDAASFVRSVIEVIGSPFVLNQNTGEKTGPPSSDTHRTPPVLITDEPGVESDNQSLIGRLTFTPIDSQNEVQPSQDETTLSAPRSNPLTRGLTFEELNITGYTPIEPKKNESCLLRVGSDCVAVQGAPDDASPYVQFGFSLSDTNLVALPEFPLLLKRILTTFRTRAGTIKHEPLRNTNGSDDRIWTRTRLTDDGSLTSSPTRQSPFSRWSIQPGWYELQSDNPSLQRTSVNFFYPNESNMNRSPSVPDHRLTEASRLPSNTTTSYPLRYTLLLLAGLFWMAFLLLATL